MKKLLVPNFVLFVFLIVTAGFTSCSKKQDEVPQVNVSNINVEYRITSASGKVTARFLVPQTGTNTLVVKEQEFDKAVSSITFTTVPANLLSIEAWNTLNTRDEITLEIFANGNLIAQGSMNMTSGMAKASGYYK
jgi:hypothetical protein